MFFTDIIFVLHGEKNKQYLKQEHLLEVTITAVLQHLAIKQMEALCHLIDIKSVGVLCWEKNV